MMEKKYIRGVLMSNEKKVQNANLDRQVLEQIPTPVMTVDRDMSITFMNQAGCVLLNSEIDDLLGKKCSNVFQSANCGSGKCKMIKAIKDGAVTVAENEIFIDGSKKYIECTAAPLRNEDGEIIGGLESIIDITRRVLDDKKLREQSDAIREMSTPTIKLWEGILVLPVIGIVDSLRAQYMMESILTRILETSSKVIILDIHGVAAVDTAVANHLIKITRATKLMGCECLLSGISPAVAQTIIQLGINMGNIRTSSTLSDALKEAFKVIEVDVSNKE